MTYQELYRYAKDAVSVSEARCLFEELLGIDRMALVEKGSLKAGKDERMLIEEAVKKRREGYPLQYIIGKWSFMGNDFIVGEGVLIPRDDTEVAVNECFSAVKNIRRAKILDLCSGSGIIAVTLAKLLPDAEITALELEDRAFGFLEKNILLNKADNVRALKGDIFRAFSCIEDKSFDAIISNPPYIKSGEISALQKEVGFEPVSALDGGEDGLDFYRCIAENWLSKLKNGGSITLEIGEEQAEDVTGLLSEKCISDIRTVKDIQGLDRVIFGTQKADN